MGDSKKIQREKNSLEKANIFSLISFGYVFSLFKKGLKRELEEENIYEILNSCNSKKCGDRIEEEWQKTPSLFKVLIYQFGLQYAVITILEILWSEANSILSPLGLSKVVSYFTPNQKKISSHQVYGYAGILVFLKIFNFVVTRNLTAWEEIIGVRIQVALRSLIFRKSLRVSASSSGKNVGNIVTLMTKDISILEKNMWMIKDITLFLIQFGTMAYLLFRKLGPPALVGIGVIFLTLTIQGYLSSKLRHFRLSVGKYSDERLQRTQETLSAIKIIRMYTWEKFCYKRISEIRRKEVTALLKVFMMNTVVETVGVIFSEISFVILIMSYIWMGYKTDTELIFYVLQLFTQLSTIFGDKLPNTLSRIAQFYASISRLNEILNSDDLQRQKKEPTGKPTVALKSVSLNLKNKSIFMGISLYIENPGLIFVVGPVGSGKSCLLKIILGEYQSLSKGTIEINGTISYCSQEPWIFPATVRENIIFGNQFDRVRYKSVLSACALEEDLISFEYGDQTVLTDRGQNLSRGQQARINLARTLYTDANIYLFDDSLAALDSPIQKFIFNRCFLEFLKDKIVIYASQNFVNTNGADRIYYLVNGKLVNNADLGIKRCTNGTEKTDRADEINDTKTDVTDIGNSNPLKLTYKETKKPGYVGMKLYHRYFQQGGGYIVLTAVILLYIGSQYTESYGDKLLSKWSDYQQKVLDLEHKCKANGTEYIRAVQNRDHTFAIYGFLTCLRIFLRIGKFFGFIWFCRTASLKLHKRMVLALLAATITFYDTHFIGNVLNRFSYDFNNIDEYLPSHFPNLENVIFHAVGSIVLIIGVNWIFLMPVVVFLIILVLITAAVMPTIRSLQRLSASTRSPLVGHINSSVDGLTTIRASNALNIVQKEFDKHQDLYSSATLMERLVFVAFAFYMDLISALFTIVVVARFLFFDHSISAGNVGLALTQVFKLTGHVELVISKWSAIETNMIAVERVAEYTDLEQEDESGQILENWPSRGEMRFESVTLYYPECKTPILKGVNFDVGPNEKIGIVGRTGAGKSSLFTVLYRLYDFEGSIKIDEIDTKTVSLKNLRKNIAIIPADPLLFSGSIRQNLDPEQEFSDDLLWQVLRRVRMDSLFQTLETIIEHSGTAYSTGQKRLICLARTALKESKILVLDEPTASMDDHTDELFQSVVSELFSNSTILMIEHKLQRVMNCHKILVINNGNIIEFEKPEILLNNPNSMFYKMCHCSEYNYFQ